MIKSQELRDIATDGHGRGCDGREYECTCGYDAMVERTLRAAAKRIDELEATARGYREQAALRQREDEQDG